MLQYIFTLLEPLSIKPQYCFCSLASEEARLRGALKGTRYTIESIVVVQYLLFRDDGAFISSVIEPPTPVSIHNFSSVDSSPALSGDVLHLRSTNPLFKEFNTGSFNNEGHSYALVYNINFSDITCYIGTNESFSRNKITIPLTIKNHSGIIYLIDIAQRVDSLSDKVISDIVDKSPLLKSFIGL